MNEMYEMFLDCMIDDYEQTIEQTIQSAKYQDLTFSIQKERLEAMIKLKKQDYDAIYEEYTKFQKEAIIKNDTLLAHNRRITKQLEEAKRLHDYKQDYDRVMEEVRIVRIANDKLKEQNTELKLKLEMK